MNLPVNICNVDMPRKDTITP